MNRALLVLMLSSLAVPFSSGQVRFRATLDGDAEVPPVTTKAGGWAIFTLNADSTLSYLVNDQGLVGVAAHIHEGQPGVSGPIVFTLAGGPDVYAGTTAALSADQVSALRAGGYYVNVHTTAFPDGAVRGQIHARPVLFGAHLTGGQVVPPVSTGALGEATFTVNGDNTITYDLGTTGLTGTSAEIRIGAPGASGDVLFTLTGGPTDWSGTTAPMSADDFTSMQELGLYVQVSSAAHAGGEIRGQIVRGLAMYGTRSPGSAGESAFFGLGAPTPGGSVTLKVNGGLAHGAGFVVASLYADAVATSGCGYYLGPPVLIQAIELDGAGQFKAVLGDLPDLPSFDLYLQFFGLDAAAPNGQFYASNGLHMPFTRF
ncbi:MAG: CHRD domain-containing protein [Planctomycetota bacterium]